ncbi:MAG: hypothetical protein ACFCD0_29070 [Gemmataceae bacterium]
MDEDQWRRSCDPVPMTQYLCQHQQIHRTKAGQRKLHLLACSWCCRFWEHLPDWAREKIVLLEQFYDGVVSREELAQALVSAHAFHSDISESFYDARDDGDTWQSLRKHELIALIIRSLLEFEQLQVRIVEICERLIQLLDTVVLQQQSPRSINERRGVITSEREQMSHLVREIFGNPHSPAKLDPIWLRWNNETVRKMAEQISTSETFHQMPVLGDALEEAGCSDESILDHCRAATKHSKGCWVLDLLLGKEC